MCRANTQKAIAVIRSKPLSISLNGLMMQSPMNVKRFLDQKATAVSRSLHQMSTSKKVHGGHVTSQCPTSWSLDLEIEDSLSQWFKDVMLPESCEISTVKTFFIRRLPILVL